MSTSPPGSSTAAASALETKVPTPAGTRITGPSALAGDFRRFLQLTKTVATLDFKLKFFGSVLGYFWQLAHPLMLFGVLYIVFTKFVKFGEVANFYPVVLLMNIVLFSYFREATGGAVLSVVERENLVRKIHFPRLAVPMSVVLTAFFNLLLNLIAVVVFALASGVKPHLSWLELPLLILALTVLITGLSALLSALYVRFRDLKPIWDVITQVIFYGSPIIYVVESITNPDIRQLLMINPVTAIIQQARHALIDPSAPSASEVIGGYPMLLIPAGITVLLFVLGLWVFNRQAPRIAEDL